MTILKSETSDERTGPECKTESRLHATHAIHEKLRAAGIRPTLQRVALCQLLCGEGDRHVTAETLFREAVNAGITVSLATVYNTLHQLTAAGFLREIAVDGARVYFDTNTSEHHHFLLDDGQTLGDIPAAMVSILNLPAQFEGFKITRTDVVVRLSRNDT